jgi:acyl carrier protein
MFTPRSARNPVLGWLTSRLAWHLDVPAHAIDPALPLAEMGVDSVRALGLVGDVEAHWDIDVDPTLVFDYPTLAHIAEFITESVGPRQLVTQ